MVTLNVLFRTSNFNPSDSSLIPSTEFLPPTHFQTLFFGPGLHLSSSSHPQVYILNLSLRTALLSSVSDFWFTFFAFRLVCHIFLLDYFSLVFFLSHLFGPSRHCNLFAEVTVGFRLRRKLLSRLKRQLKSSSHPR
jgi:hypothetical protein